MAERGAQETSSVVVETVQKVARPRNAGPMLPVFKSDASKVSSKGMGLKKAYLQKQNMFTVSASDAGQYNFIFVFQKYLKITKKTEKYFQEHYTSHHYKRQ